MLVGPYTFQRLVQARGLLVSDEGERLTVRAVADAVGLSPYHFIRQFGALYGVTPTPAAQWCTDRARAAAARGGASVTEACMEVGFSSLGSFSSLFARRVGVSPVRYRGFVQVPRTFPPALIPGCLGLLAQLPVRNFREARRP